MVMPTLFLILALMQIHEADHAKVTLWENFAQAHNIAERSVPLFDIRDGHVTVIPYGRNNRLVLKRSVRMEALMGDRLIKEHQK